MVRPVVERENGSRRKLPNREAVRSHAKSLSVRFHSD